MKRAVPFVAIAVLGVVLLAACAKRPGLDQGEAARITPTPSGSISAPSSIGSAAASEASRASAPDTVARSTPSVSSKVGQALEHTGAPRNSPLQDIFFDFDQDAIRDDQKGVLDANVAWLKARPNVKTTVEGHADERGTSEYNLALGDRRAKTTREYLVAKGIQPARLTVVSYGEERPFMLGHDESAWRWNRRAHFGITAE